MYVIQCRNVLHIKIIYFYNFCDYTKKIMDEELAEGDPVSMETLERTAAWVKEVATMKAEIMNEQEELLREQSKSHDHGNPDDPDISSEQLGSMYKELLREQLDSSVNHEIDIPTTVKEFKEACEKLGISQRFAAKHIMEKTSQGNLSFLLDKGRHKKWNELSPRGRIPYIRMRRWLDSDLEKQQTTSILTQTKEYKKTGPKDGGCRREKFTIFQLMVLCRFFEEDPNPNQTTRTLLAEKLDASMERITIWFQNQRARGFPAQRILSQSNFTRKSVDIRNVQQSPLATGQHNSMKEHSQSNVPFQFMAAHAMNFDQPMYTAEAASSQHISSVVATHNLYYSGTGLQSRMNSTPEVKIKHEANEAYENGASNDVQQYIFKQLNLKRKCKTESERDESKAAKFDSCHSNNINGTKWRNDNESPPVNTVAAHNKSSSQSSFDMSAQSNKSLVHPSGFESLYNGFHLNKQTSCDSDEEQPINFSMSAAKS
ncbi:hypothetical protein KUTeg_008634 [Tegillarca granosa]|uniref:One cut domain family member n=1 Tax=Tegillarca granosa TaxID=220873 RepID=A0ABQ9F9N4_TEGGR|nr:hypothetical protein KUTeg_008634 [Tegillarca granosa]